MKSTDEEFDDGIRKKVNAIDTEFNEVYWLKAKDLIKAERQFKANILFFSFVLFVLIGAIAGMGFFMNNYQHKQKVGSTELSLAGTQALTKNTTLTNISFARSLVDRDQKNAVNFNQGSLTKRMALTKVSFAHENKANKLISIENSNMKLSAKTTQSSPSLSINQAHFSNKTHVENNNKLDELQHKISEDALPEIFVINDTKKATAKEEIEALLIEFKGYKPNQFKSIFCDTCNLVRNNFYKQFNKKTSASYLAAEVCLTSFNGSPFNENTISYGFGFKYFYFFSKKFGVSSGIEYRKLNEELGERKYTRINYDFGSTQQTKIITTQRLDYLQIPVWLLYHVNNKYQLNAGVNILTLLQTTEKIQTIQTGDVKTNTVGYEHGYYNAISATDIQLSVGSSYAVTRSFFVHAILYKGLKDISNNTVFKTDKTDYNNGFTLGIGYKFN